MSLLSVFVYGGKRMAQTKTKSPIALINELTVSCQESYDSWKCIYNGGGSDPFWADGVNLNLVRNHIIYYKRQMQEISEEYGCFLPEVYYREVPPKVESDYMAETDKILEDALKVKEIFYNAFIVYQEDQDDTSNFSEEIYYKLLLFDNYLIYYLY